MELLGSEEQLVVTALLDCWELATRDEPARLVDEIRSDELARLVDGMNALELERLVDNPVDPELPATLVELACPPELLLVLLSSSSPPQPWQPATANTATHVQRDKALKSMSVFLSDRRDSTDSWCREMGYTGAHDFRQEETDPLLGSVNQGRAARVRWVAFVDHHGWYVGP